MSKRSLILKEAVTFSLGSIGGITIFLFYFHSLQIIIFLMENEDNIY